MTVVRKKKKKGGYAAIIITLAILVAIVAMLFVQGRLSQMKRVSEVNDVVPPSEQTFETDESASPDTLHPDDVEWTETLEAEPVEGVTNILLIGQDARAGQGRQRSDTMIICSLNANTDTITMCSLMRDLYVPIPGYSDNRINAAYVFGGMPLLDQTIEEAFGVHIDGNIEVNLEGFLDSMAAVGNLDIELTEDEAEYMNENPAMGSGTDITDENWHLSEGVNSLTPAQALAYSRMRHVGNSDYERTERQRKMLTAAFKKLTGSSVSTLISLSDDILPSLTTDMSQAQILALIQLAHGMQLNSESYRIPVNGAYTSEGIRGMAVLVPDLAANSNYLKEYLYGEES